MKTDRVWGMVRVKDGVRGRGTYIHTLHISAPDPPLDSIGYRYPWRRMALRGISLRVKVRVSI